MDERTSRDIETSYDRVAREYAENLYDELRGKPLDRELLDRFAERLRDGGPVCDLGCGPGQVARYLKDRNVEARGVDLSPGMVAEARRRNPDIPFSQGDMLALDLEDGTWAGIAAFYAIVHLHPEEIPRAFAEMKRVLRPGGLLLLAFHVGEEIIHRDELWGQEVDLDFRFFPSEDIEAALRAAGFEIEEVNLRDPYPEVEHPSRRSYILAQAGLGLGLDQPEKHVPALLSHAPGERHDLHVGDAVLPSPLEESAQIDIFGHLTAEHLSGIQGFVLEAAGIEKHAQKRSRDGLIFGFGPLRGSPLRGGRQVVCLEGHLGRFGNDPESSSCLMDDRQEVVQCVIDAMVRRGYDIGERLITFLCGTDQACDAFYGLGQRSGLGRNVRLDNFFKLKAKGATDDIRDVEVAVLLSPGGTGTLHGT